MVRSCFNPTNSCICCAVVLSLVATHKTTPINTARTSHRIQRRLCFGGVISTAIGASATTGDFGGELTGLPHFRQNCASSGRVAPHLLHPRMTLVVGGVVLFVDIRTGLSALRV